MITRSIRDLIQDLPAPTDPEPTLTSIARTVVTEGYVIPDEHPGSPLDCLGMMFLTLSGAGSKTLCRV
jgi:hypothetical protein